MRVEELGRAGAGFAYEQGFKAGLEAAAKVAENYGCTADRDQDDDFICGEEIAEKIRALKEKKE